MVVKSSGSGVQCLGWMPGSASQRVTSGKLLNSQRLGFLIGKRGTGHTHLVGLV